MKPKNEGSSEKEYWKGKQLFLEAIKFRELVAVDHFGTINFRDLTRPPAILFIMWYSGFNCCPEIQEN